MSINRAIQQPSPEEPFQRMARAWREGYAAGWKDQECDFPPHTSENPYTGKETNEEDHR